MPPTQSGISLDRNRVKNPKSHSTENQKLCDTRPYGDLLVVTLLGTPAPPPAGLALRGLLLLATALGLPATLGRLPLRGCLPAGSATTSLRCHGACSTLVLLRRETTKRTKKTNKYVSMGSAGLHTHFGAPTETGHVIKTTQKSKPTNILKQTNGPQDPSRGRVIRKILNKTTDPIPNKTRTLRVH